MALSPPMHKWVAGAVGLRDGGLVMSTVLSADEVRPAESGANRMARPTLTSSAVRARSNRRHSATATKTHCASWSRPRPKGERAPREVAQPPKVINLMEAPKRSLAQDAVGLWHSLLAYNVIPGWADLTQLYGDELKQQ
jgi:hypothetical protein